MLDMDGNQILFSLYNFTLNYSNKYLIEVVLIQLNVIYLKFNIFIYSIYLLYPIPHPHPHPFQKIHKNIFIVYQVKNLLFYYYLLVITLI